mgnify:CR=1 FL=1
MLVAERTDKEAFKAVKSLIDFLVLRQRPPRRDNYSSIDILTRSMSISTLSKSRKRGSGLNFFEKKINCRTFVLRSVNVNGGAKRLELPEKPIKP